MAQPFILFYHVRIVPIVLKYALKAYNSLGLYLSNVHVVTVRYTNEESTATSGSNSVISSIDVLLQEGSSRQPDTRLQACIIM